MPLLRAGLRAVWSRGVLRLRLTIVSNALPGVLFLIAAAGACAHDPPPPVAPPCKEPELKVMVRGSDRLNMDEGGRSLAVVVRVYQLKSLKTLDDADFDGVWQHDRDTLGEDLMSVDEVTIDPSDKKIVPVRRNPDARYL